MSLIGMSAPSINATAVVREQIVENFSLAQYLGKYVILFFYPLDFTFVCPTELHAFQERLSDFEQRNACVIGCSVDSCYAHLAWLNLPKEKGGIQGVTYPLISDLNKKISTDFQILKEDMGIAYRALFMIDRKGIVRHQLVNDLPLGRSVDEVVRILDALIAHEQCGGVCPANWSRGSHVMPPTKQGVVDYFSAR